MKQLVCCCCLQDRNAILADEMGLGKTVQCVSLVGLLSQHMQVRGPFLVVVPLSTVPNWIKEFRKWVPMVSCCVHMCSDGRLINNLVQTPVLP
jgi:chromodomain-helicase-DNA-binding protein 1